MDPEIKDLLKEDVRLAHETNDALKELIRYQKWARWFDIIKWIIVIGVSLGALYYVQPILENLLGTYRQLLSTVSDASVKTLPK